MHREKHSSVHCLCRSIDKFPIIQSEIAPILIWPHIKRYSRRFCRICDRRQQIHNGYKASLESRQTRKWAYPILPLSVWLSVDQDICMHIGYTAWLVNEHLYLDGLLCAWWRHQIKTFSALLALCAGIWLVSGKFPSQRPVTRIFGVFFDLRLNKRLSKQSWGGWFKTPSRSLWRHRNVCRWKGKQQMMSFMDVKTLRMIGNMTIRPSYL